MGSMGGRHVLADVGIHPDSAPNGASLETEPGDRQREAGARRAQEAAARTDSGTTGTGAAALGPRALLALAEPMDRASIDATAVRADAPRPARAAAPRKAPAKKSAKAAGDAARSDDGILGNARLSDEPDPWDLNPAAPAPVAKAPAKKKPSKATPEGLEWLALIERYFKAYERVRGVRPLFDGADARAMQRLLEKAGKDHERAGRIIDRAFADSWWGPKVTIREIASNAARFDGNGPARHFGSHMQAPAKNADGSIKKPKLVNLDD